MTTHQLKALAEWLLNGEHGTSSLCLAGMMLGSTTNFRLDTPSDPDDFRRCYLLINYLPDGVALFKNKVVGEKWKAIAENWEELCRLFEKEKISGYAPELYQKMKDLGL